MSRIVSALTIVCLAGLLLTVEAQVRTRDQGPLRVVVDASKDGGLWWFPQSENFNANQYHQGKAFGDFMRRQGWKVTELPRGQVITLDILRDVDVVIKPAAYFDYSEDEAVAYREAVRSGTRLLMVGSGATPDAVANIFGLQYENRNRFGPVEQWIPHALTANIECCSVAWSSLSELPPGAVALAWLEPLSANPHPVLVYLPYGNGYVVFAGGVLMSPYPNQLFSETLIKSVARYTPEELAQLPLGAPVMKPQRAELGPRLIAPAPGATLPQPESGEWRFDWDDVPGAKSYEIVVTGATAAFPLVLATTEMSEYIHRVNPGYIADHNLLGWGWRVRAQYQNGTWGPWSRTRRFNVKLRNQ